MDSPEPTPTVSFFAQALPRGKPRQSRRDAFLPSTAVQNYRAWADLVRLEAQRAARGHAWLALWEGPVALRAQFLFPIPDSWSKHRKLEAMAGTVPHVSKPDLDNLLKGVQDPLSGVIWADDRQVVEYRRSTKHYGPSDAVGAYVDIWLLEDT